MDLGWRFLGIAWRAKESRTLVFGDGRRRDRVAERGGLPALPRERVRAEIPQLVAVLLGSKPGHAVRGHRCAAPCFREKATRVRPEIVRQLCLHMDEPTEKPNANTGTPWGVLDDEES